jgi:hypothetical protein
MLRRKFLGLLVGLVAGSTVRAKLPSCLGANEFTDRRRRWERLRQHLGKEIPVMPQTLFVSLTRCLLFQRRTLSTRSTGLSGRPT